MKKAGIISGIVAAAVVVTVVMIVIFMSGSNKTVQAPSPSTSSGNNSATITYSDSGFSPDTITVKSGDTVTIKNASNSSLQFESNPHPVHTDDTDLNVGTVESGQTKTFVVTQKGSFGYHNHLAAGDKGKIVIE